MQIYLNGRFLDARDAKISVFDSGFLYGDGIFETLRARDGKIWQMEKHLERLYESARMRGWKLSWKPAEMAEAIEKTLARNEPEKREMRIRVMITPGAAVTKSGSGSKAARLLGGRGALPEASPTLFIWVQPLEKVSENIVKRGVTVITFPLERSFPRMKTTSMQPLIIARLEMKKKRAYEALLMNHKGNITEATWANFFIVRKKKIITPKTGVLLGTTRDAVLKFAKSLFRIKLQDVSRRELLNADECFLTNAPKGIVPVVKVDGKNIGTGRVGPVTKHLMQEFEKRIWK